MTMTKKWLSISWLVACVLVFAPMSGLAAEVSIKSDTLLRIFERDTTAGSDETVLPGYEYLQLDIDTPDEPGLAFHLYGWGRWDMADSEYFKDQTAGELLYGYLEYTRQEANFNARLGRFYVFEGVSNEAVDGFRLSSDLGKYFSASAYAGQPVALDSENGRDGDSTYGARLGHRLGGWYDVGLSYKKVNSDDTNAEEMAGVDLGLYLPYGINLFGFSTYNYETQDWGEHSYELRFALAQVNFRPFYQQFNYEDYFGTGDNSANPFRFLSTLDEELKIFGLDLGLPVGESWQIGGKFKHYDYDVLDDTSQYYALLATWRGEGLSQVGGEFGRMQADDVAQNEYDLVRLYTYWDQMPESCPVAFASADLVYVAYDKDIFNEDSSLFFSLGVGKRFLEDALELTLSGDYSSDPYFDEDVRGMLTASYRFSPSM